MPCSLVRCFVAIGAVTLALLSQGAAASAPARLSATIAAKPNTSGVLLATLEGRRLSWKLHVGGGASVARIRLGRALGSGPVAATLCTGCPATTSGSVKLGAAAARSVAAGASHLELRQRAAPSRAVQAPLVLGFPTLEITSPRDGDSLALPAQVTFRVRAFRVGRSPLGSITAAAAGSAARPVRLELGAQEGTGTLPDDKSAFLPGRRDLIFRLTSADGVPISNPEAAFTVHDLTIVGRR